MSECVDEEIIINNLLEFIRSSEGDCSSIKLFDAYLKDIEKEISNIIKQLKKRIEKTSKQNGSTSGAILDCFNNLQIQQTILEKVRQIEEKYGCFVDIYQLCENFPIIYAQELYCIEENRSDKLEEVVSQELKKIGTYYDAYAETIVTNILNLENKLSKCAAIKPEYIWITNGTVLLNKLKKLAKILIFSQTYLNATAATKTREYWRGYWSHVPVYISQSTSCSSTYYRPTYTYYRPVYTTYYH